MIKIVLKSVTYLVFLSASMSALSMSEAEESAKKELGELLKKQTFDKEAVLEGKEVDFEGKKFKLGMDGRLYLERKGNKDYPLQIFIDEQAESKEFLLFDNLKRGILKPNPLSTSGASPEQLNAFDAIVSAQRQYGIYAIETINTDCFFAVGEQRLKDKPFERLLAMKRPDNPRPLVFKDDEEYEDFKKDLVNLFSDFKGPESYITIIGTSTTFFSENPRKGRNRALFEKAPQCLKRINDASATQEIYTFDTPGKDPSDLDIQILIPKLSELCHRAQVPGNDGKREVYYENTLDKCLLKADEERLRAMVKPVEAEIDSLFDGGMAEGGELANFFTKWREKIDNRAINFSVHILLDQSKEPRREAGVNNFEQSEYLKGRFVIPVN